MPKSKAERRRKKSTHKKTAPKVSFERKNIGEGIEIRTGPGEDARRRFPLRQKLKRSGGAVSLSVMRARARAKAIRERAKAQAKGETKP